MTRTAVALAKLRSLLGRLFTGDIITRIAFNTLLLLWGICVKVGTNYIHVYTLLHRAHTSLG